MCRDYKNERYRRHLGGNDGAPSAASLTRLRMISLEFLEQHRLAGAADAVNEQAGKPFWGCQKYPKCTGIAQIS
jgi:hypothetical protein